MHFPTWILPSTFGISCVMGNMSGLTAAETSWTEVDTPRSIWYAPLRRSALALSPRAWMRNYGKAAFGKEIPCCEENIISPCRAEPLQDIFCRHRMKGLGLPHQLCWPADHSPLHWVLPREHQLPWGPNKKHGWFMIDLNLMLWKYYSHYLSLKVSLCIHSMNHELPKATHTEAWSRHNGGASGGVHLCQECSIHVGMGILAARSDLVGPVE